MLAIVVSSRHPLPARVLLWLFVCVLVFAEARAQAVPLQVGHNERLMVIAPHPDDESLGAAGLVERVIKRGGSVRIVLVTAGDGFVEAVIRETFLPRPRPAEYIAYGERRISETRAALRELDGQQIRLQFLGFPDGGLHRLLNAHWLRGQPERSQTTQASDPPYDEAVAPDVAYDGTDLRREMRRLLREFRPTILAVPDPLDRHPDHRASGLFALLALDDCAGSRAKPRIPMPHVLAYLIHWPSWPPGWDDNHPHPDARDGLLTLPADLPRHGAGPVTLRLTDTEVEAKRAALARHATQQEEMASFLGAFVKHSEPFTLLTPDDVAGAGDIIERGRRQQPTPPTQPE